MKKIAVIFLLAVCTFAQAGEIVLELTYDGKNVFISNPVRANGEFCTYRISVNGNEIAGMPNSSSFEITLDEMSFKTGDNIKIVITHYDECTPVILSQH
jgi:hypothetical protein